MGRSNDDGRDPAVTPETDRISAQQRKRSAAMRRRNASDGRDPAATPGTNRLSAHA